MTALPPPRLLLCARRQRTLLKRGRLGERFERLKDGRPAYMIDLPYDKAAEMARHILDLVKKR